MQLSKELHGPAENHLLSALSVEEHERLRPNLEHIDLALGKVVYESGKRLNYVYFPTSSVVSSLYTTQDGSTAEMALTGNEGVVGTALFLGGYTTPHRALVQLAGGSFRLKAKVS